MTTELVPVADIERMATAVAKSGLFGVKNVDQAMALMLVAQAEGLHPAIAARDYDIIQGRPAKKSEAMLRDFIGSGGKVEWHKLDDTAADATFAHPAGGKVRISWDIKRATVAGLAGKDMWKKFPRQMLRARCISEGIRTVCPMATGNMYVPEEVRDMPAQQMRDVTPPAGGDDQDVAAIKQCTTMAELHAAWKTASKAWKDDGRDLAELIAAKDAKKAELEKPAQDHPAIDIDPDTGEILPPNGDEQEVI